MSAKSRESGQYAKLLRGFCVAGWHIGLPESRGIVFVKCRLDIFAHHYQIVANVKSTQQYEHSRPALENYL
ncbi:MAG: hypothetical protein KIS77_01045 [Saprospiraceae bacterium]|nr:hypothetical protein [Saprospiraceae bacterium]